MEKLIANETTYQALAASVRGGRLSHALLIEGPSGSGKSCFARYIAAAALCTAPPGERPCGSCRDCVKAEKEVHPDILTYSGGGGSRSFHVDTVRALRQEAFVRPGEAEGKVLILENVQDMSPQAQNALLKIIEEPPRNVTFVLTCENRFTLLKTTLSRVQTIPLRLPTPEQCADLLRQRLPEEDPARLAELSRKAGGNVGKALSLLEADAGDDPAEKAAELLYHACVGEEFLALRALAAYERDRPGLTALLDRMTEVLSEALLRPEDSGRLAELVRRAGRLQLIEILDIIRDTALAVAQNTGGLLLVTSFCARIRLVLADG